MTIFIHGRAAHKSVTYSQDLLFTNSLYNTARTQPGLARHYTQDRSITVTVITHLQKTAAKQWLDELGAYQLILYLRLPCLSNPVHSRAGNGSLELTHDPLTHLMCDP